MLALRCPYCHAVAPIPISTREALHCDSCGRRSELPDDARRQLELAERLLKSTDPAKRKLSETQARALLSVNTGRVGLRVLHGVFILAALIWALGGGAVMRDGDRALGEQAMFAAMGFLPLLFVVIAAWRGGSKLTARRQALAEKCAASPPVVPGAPARCRLCAAPMQSQGIEKVASCTYCGADNLLGKEVLARAVHRHKAATANLEAEVKQALTDVGSEAWSAYFKALRSAIVAPVLGFGSSFVLVLVLYGIHLEVDRSVEYAVVKDEGRSCIARVVEGKTLVMRRGETAMDVVRRAFEPAVALERADALRFVGLILRDVHGKEWKVKEVKRRLDGRNIVIFAEDDAPTWTELEAFCLGGST